MIYLVPLLLLIGYGALCAWLARLKGRTPWVAFPAGLLGPLGLIALLVIPEHPVAVSWEARERERRENLHNVLPLFWSLAVGSLLVLLVVFAVTA